MKLRKLKRRIIDKKHYILKSYYNIIDAIHNYSYLAGRGNNVYFWTLVCKVTAARKFNSIEEAKLFINENNNLKRFEVVCYEDEVKEIKKRNK